MTVGVVLGLCPVRGGARFPDGRRPPPNAGSPAALKVIFVAFVPPLSPLSAMTESGSKLLALHSASRSLSTTGAPAKYCRRCRRS